MPPLFLNLLEKSHCRNVVAFLYVLKTEQCSVFCFKYKNPFSEVKNHIVNMQSKGGAFDGKFNKKQRRITCLEKNYKKVFSEKLRQWL